MSRGSTSAFAEPQKVTSSGIKTLPEIGAACLSDSAAPCRCPKLALKLRKSEPACLRASTQRLHAHLVGKQRLSNRLQRPLPPPKLLRRSWICGRNTKWKNNYWINDRKEPYATSNLLTRHVLPRLGGIGINAITVEDIRDVLVPMWTTKYHCEKGVA